ncbi:hypothetical protein ACJMK2_003568, partial [Sinanodonta woodiana]
PPRKMITAQQIQRQRERQEKKTIKQSGESDTSDSTPASPFVTFEEDDEEQGATAEQLEEEQGDTAEEIDRTIKKGIIPSQILIKSARDEIRRYKEDELIVFTANNFEKRLRDQYIFDRNAGKITSLKNWTRIVFLTSKYKESLSAGDGYSEFHQKVKNLIKELKSA